MGINFKGFIPDFMQSDAQQKRQHAVGKDNTPFTFDTMVPGDKMTKPLINGGTDGWLSTDSDSAAGGE